MKDKTRIVLADDHPIVLTGLRNLIESESDFVVVGEATSGPEALRVIREQRPDIAIVDISMTGMSGIVLTRRLTGEAPDIRILILTLHEDRAYLRQALDAGARGYVVKRSAAANSGFRGSFGDLGRDLHRSGHRQSRAQPLAGRQSRRDT